MDADQRAGPERGAFGGRGAQTVSAAEPIGIDAAKAAALEDAA